MDFQEIVEKLKEANIKPEDLQDIIEGYGSSEFTLEFLETLVGNVEEVNSIGGGEGEGDYVERVYHFKDHNVYIKITGFYSSYNGTDWGEHFREVKPKEKVVTVFE